MFFQLRPPSEVPTVTKGNDMVKKEDEKLENKKHHHRGKSSESRLYKDIILKELNIRSGQTILDAGCGNGYMSKEFLKLLNNTGKVYALDPDESAIEILKEETQGTNIETIVGDITRKTQIEDATVDLMYLSTVFHGFSKGEIDGFQKEVKRLLKPNAVLAIIEIIKEETPFGPPLDIRFSPDELKETITLNPKSLVAVGEYFYMQTFENIS
jgi:ubiquinone/menaquinone biosynthesis C-methylase UbiE